MYMHHGFLEGVTRALLAMGGVPIPEGVVITRDQNDFDYKETFPAVVKPTRMENSVGVELVHNKEEMEAALEQAWLYGDTAVVEVFKAGREVRCSR